MQERLEESNARIIKERESARKTIEDTPPVIKETPVIVQDTEKIDALTAEVESLKVLVTFMTTVMSVPKCVPRQCFY